MTAGTGLPDPGGLTVAVDRGELAAARALLPGRVAVVMTMGALHEGHAALMRRARELADHLVVTVFVNPLQFAAGEDLHRYPRTLDADLELCRREGARVVFTPAPDEVYRQAPTVRVSAGRLGERLEGAARPGHFDGVLTVVLKLLHLVRPDVAVFGQKDAQQLACIRAMVHDLDVPVQVVGAPTVREADGLALSSRNRYLTPKQRTTALALSRGLEKGLATGLATGGASAAAAARAVLATEPGLVLDYVERVDSATFDSAEDGDLLVAAALVGGTRLIDNVVLPTRGPAS